MKHRNRAAKLISIIIIALLMPFFAHSQWKTALSLGGSYFKGNVNRSDLRFEGSAAHVDTVFEYSTNIKALYGENNKVKSNEEYVGSVKVDYLPANKISPFALASGFKNIYKGIDLRMTGLVGIKYLIYKKQDSLKNLVSNYSVSAAMQYDIEDYHSDMQKKEIARLSIRPKIQQRLGKGVFFDHITFLRYNVKDFSDYQIDSRTSLTNQLTRKIFLQLSLDYDYQSKPPVATIKKEDMAIMVSLVVKI
jgi:putative salt-induced outer membrane protein YdiY